LPLTSRVSLAQIVGLASELLARYLLEPDDESSDLETEEREESVNNVLVVSLLKEASNNAKQLGFERKLKLLRCLLPFTASNG
jgi:hypothetical protein